MKLLDVAEKCFFQKYACFSGRASRSEFFLWFLWMFLSGVMCSVLILLLSGVVHQFQRPPEQSILFAIGILFILYLVPTLSVTVRRLHDSGRSALHLVKILLGFIPYLGLIFQVWLFVLMCYPSDGDNQYGPKNPATTPKRFNNTEVEDVDL